MKIITLSQPWASLIAIGLKRYETRHWSTTYRGKLLIHASKHRMGYECVQVWHKAIALARQSGISLLPEKVPFPEQLPYGVVVAIADLTKCLRMMNGWVETDPPEGFTVIQSKSELERSAGSWEPGRYAFRLDNVRSIPNPVPFKSRQGKLLNAPAEIITLINQQLMEVA